MLYLPSEKGQGIVEYALILVLVAIIVIVVLALIGRRSAMFSPTSITTSDLGGKETGPHL